MERTEAARNWPQWELLGPKRQGAWFRAGDTGGPEFRRAQPIQNKMEEGQTRVPGPLSSTVWCSARFSHLAGLGGRVRIRCVDTECLPGSTEQARRANKDLRDTQSSGSELGTGSQLQLSKIPYMILAGALPCSVSASSSGGWRQWIRSGFSELATPVACGTRHTFRSTQFLPKYTPLCMSASTISPWALFLTASPIVWSTPRHT